MKLHILILNNGVLINRLVAVGVPVTILSMVGVGAGVVVAAKKYKWKIFPQLPSTSVS